MQLRHRRWSLLIALMAAFALFASACVDDEGDGESSDGGDDGGSEPSAEPAQGVTDDGIKIGYSYLDFQSLVDQGLSPSGWGDQELAFQTFVDNANENGGVADRQLEAVYEPYSPIGTEEAEAACLALTQDEEVFAVIGGFVGPAEPANTCIAGRQETALFGGVQSPERLAEATAPWATDRPTRSQQAQVLLSLLDEEGALGDASVALVTNTDAEDVQDDVRAALAEFGVEPVEDLVIDAPIGDIVAEDQAWATLAERIRGAGADALLVVGNPSSAVRNAASQGLDVDLWITDQESLQSLGSATDLEDARGALTAAPLTGQELWDDESLGECREIFTEANPDIEIIDPDDLEEGDEDWPQGITVACRFFRLFEAVVNGADGDLSNAGVQTAIDGLGEFTIPGQPFASLGPDKFTSNDSFRLAEFDPDVGQDGGLEPVTEIEDVTP